MKITFCGAAGTVTGSCHMIELDSGFRILLDCGLYQGREQEYNEFNFNWLFDPASIDVLILSHAHIDHCGRVPKLVRDGFKGEIICTHATRDLASIMLMDSAIIQEHDAQYARKKRFKEKYRWDPLYTSKDVKAATAQFVGVGYDRWYRVSDAVQLVFRDAGHILGSASVVMEINEGKSESVLLGFSGDIGRPARPILRDPVHMEPVDYLLCESTYGGKEHHGQPHDEEALLSIISKTCVEQRGKLLIPAFSVGRTQELVYMIDRLETHGKLPDIPVYVDSPLAVNATELFIMHAECYDDEILAYMLEDPNPFGFSRLHFIKDKEDSKKLNNVKGPCIIISASGMMQAGRIKHHLYHNIEDPRNTVLVVGHVSDGTLGADIRDRQETVKIFGKELQLRASVEILDSFSAHADNSEILDFIDRQDTGRLKEIFLVHGENNRQEVLRADLIKMGFRKVTIPKIGDVANLH